MWQEKADGLKKIKTLCLGSAGKPTILNLWNADMGWEWYGNNVMQKLLCRFVTAAPRAV